MKKKIVSIVLLSVMAMVLAGCGGPKPEDAVSNYLSAAKLIDAKTMAIYILPSNEVDIQDTEALAGNGEDDQYIKYFTEYMTTNAKKMTYSIAGTEVTGNKAIVTVDCKYIDGGPLLKATIGEAFMKVFGMAFTGVEQTEEETNQMFLGIMKEQSEIIGETYKEATVKIDCVKQDGKWYISKVNDDLEDVVTMGFTFAGKDLENSFGDTSDSTQDSQSTVMEQAKENNMELIEKKIGDDITLATIKLKVNKAEEKNTLKAEYSEPTVAKEGAKFIVANIDITNITNQEFAFYTDDIIVVDNKGREYTPYDDTMWAIDDYIDSRNLSPAIKESGSLVYELPTDSTGYYLVIGKAGTNELYKIILK